MPGRIIFLLEEQSMKVLLDGLLPTLFTGWAHDGKSDLERSLRVKLPAWRIPGDRFVVVRDNDGADRVDIKARLVALCAQCGRAQTMVRLVCQEGESWYIGDLTALASAYPQYKPDTPALRKRFAQPDTWRKPSVELARLIPDFQKRSGARLMAQHMRADRNISPSFQAFMDGVRRLATQPDRNAAP